VQRDPLVGTEIAGRFLVEELIGQGGMGKVYKARHLALEKTVCLKTLKPALLEDPTLVGRFEREAKAASRLNHPNVIAVLDFGRIGDEGTLYIAMEFVQGRDLRLVLRDEWPLGEDRLVHIMSQVLGALGEAHTHNVVHRDLKPENIMIEQRRDSPDFVKVLDFGIAKIMDSDMPGLTRSDVVCGTPQYMAPEQATGSALDARCDLYAVGVILYQLTTGHLPFDGQNSMEVLTKHVNEMPVPPRQKQPDAPISAAMEKLILHALEKEPSARPQTAEEFRRLLLAIPQKAQSEPTAEHAGAHPAPTQMLPPPPPPASGVAIRAPQAARKGAAGEGAVTEPLQTGSKRPLVIGAAAAVVLAVAAAVAMAAKSPSTAPVPGPVAGQTTPGANPGAATPGANTPAAATPSPGVAAAAQKLSRDPAKAATLVEEASRLQRDGDTGAARDLLEQAVGLDPDNAAIHFRLGTLYSSTKPARAREEYEAAIRLDEAKYGEQARMMMQALQ
jgi:serine/threonine-protein kinase